MQSADTDESRLSLRAVRSSYFYQLIHIHVCSWIQFHACKSFNAFFRKARDFNKQQATKVTRDILKKNSMQINLYKNQFPDADAHSDQSNGICGPTFFFSSSSEL